MVGFKALSMGAKAALLAGGAAVAVLAAYGGWSRRQAPAPFAVASPKQPTPETAQGITAPISEAADTAAFDAAAPETAALDAAAPDASPPKTTVSSDPVLQTAPVKAAPATEPTTDAVSEPATVVVAEPAPVVVADPAPDTASESATVAVAEPTESVAKPASVALSPNPDAVVPSEIAPSFDVVRVEPDGTTVVAGRASPGSKIVLRVDGAEISATTVDDTGNFAAFFVLNSSEAPRLLTMASILPDQSEISAAAQVALSPTEAPVVIAAAEPDVIAPEPKAIAPEPLIAVVPMAPAALLVTKDGVKVLQTGDQNAATGQLADLSIATISYTPAGDVQLSGRAAAGAFVRIYLDDAPLIDVKAGEDGLWAATLPEIIPGIYTLRADQLAADGSVTARFETPFKRETEDALAAATQTPDPAVAVAEPVAETSIAATPEPAALALEAAASAVNPTAVADATFADEPAPAVSITVQPGFTLWGIASQQFGDGVMYVQVFAANKDKIRDPDLIYPGQIFVIPKATQ